MTSPALIKESEAAQFLGKTVFTLQKWRGQKKGPAFFKLGHHVRYSEADLMDWIQSNRVEAGGQ